MATITIRNLPDEVHKGLRVRAAENGRSMEEEIRLILAEHAQPVHEYKNPKTPAEIDEAVRRAQELFAPMAKTYSVDQYLEEKRAEARREWAKMEGLDDPPSEFHK